MVWEADDMNQGNQKATKLIREGKYAAEVVIKLQYSVESWSPTRRLGF
jgi:hypothetical protein